MKYKSCILQRVQYEIEIDLLRDLREQLKLRLVKAGIKTTSDDPIYDFFNFQKRYIEPKPRTIEKSKEFFCPADYKHTLSEIEEKILKGYNLVPYLSKHIKNAGYSDGILNDWNIHHLHLSSKLGKDGFALRSDYQLFAFFTENTCYFLQVYPHSKPNLYSTQEMVKIIDNNWPELIVKNKIQGILSVEVTDAEYAELRKSNITTFVQTSPNNIYGLIGGGYMSNGASQSALSSSDFWHNICRKVQIDIVQQLTEKILTAISQVRDTYTTNLCIRLLFFKSKDEIVLSETCNHVIVTINYAEGYIRVCKPEELFGTPNVHLSRMIPYI